MKILVTGGAGFIGSNFIIYWLNKYSKDKIINLDKLTYAGNLENLISVENNQNYKFIKGDICDEKLLDKIMPDMDAIINFAAETHVDRSIISSDEFIQTNISGTHKLLKTALKYKLKKFHHISTDEVYGSLEIGSKKKFSENTCYNPSSPYAASKAASDFLVLAFYKSYGMNINISNCSNNFGPYQYPEKLIPLVITNLLEGKKVPIYGNGKNIRDWLFVEDHCKALDLIFHLGKSGETYCIGGMKNEISNIEVVETIIKLMQKDKNMIEFVSDRPGHDLKYAIDSTKIKNSFGWEPKNDLCSNLEKTINWYKQNLNWWRKIKKGKFKDYYKMQYSK